MFKATAPAHYANTGFVIWVSEHPSRMSSDLLDVPSAAKAVFTCSLPLHHYHRLHIKEQVLAWNYLLPLSQQSMS